MLWRGSAGEPRLPGGPPCTERSGVLGGFDPGRVLRGRETCLSTRVGHAIECVSVARSRLGTGGD